MLSFQAFGLMAGETPAPLSRRLRQENLFRKTRFWMIST